MFEEETYKVLPGTTDAGKDYEHLSAAAYTLKLSRHEEVEDFKLSFDNASFGKFDDVVLEVKYTNARERCYSIQLKHKTNHRMIATSALFTSSGDYSVDKYFKSYKFHITDINIRNNSVFILSTNASMPELERKVLHENGLYRITIIRHDQCCTGTKNFFNTSTKDSGFIYKFTAELLDEQRPCEEQVEYQKFFEIFYLYTSQRNVDSIKLYMTELLRSIYHCQDVDMLNNVCKSYVEFFREHKADRAGSRNKLTMEMINLKMTEILFTPHIQTISFNQMDQRAKLLKNAILQFQVTLVKNGPSVVEWVKRIWNNSGVDDQVLTHQTAKSYGLKARYTNRQELTTLQKTKISWLRKQVPLIIKVDTSNQEYIYRTISLNNNTPQNKYILVVDHLPDPALPGEVFQNLNDIKTNGIYEEIVRNFSCCIQGRANVSLQDITGTGDEMNDVIRTEDLFYLLNDTVVIGDGVPKLPEPFISRHVKKIMIDFNVVTLQEDLLVIAREDLELPVDAIIINVEDYLQSDDLPRDLRLHDSNFILVSNSVLSEGDIDTIARKSPQRNVHHLNYVQEEIFEWICSSGSVAKLKKFLQISDDHVVPDSELLSHFQNKTNVILMDPGMGKSVAMDYLKYTCPPNLWPIKVNLKPLKDFFEQQPPPTVEAILKRVLKTPKDDLTGRVRNVFENRKAVLFLWDGLDELDNTTCIDNAIDGFAKLSQLGYRQWIAGRNHLKKKLEAAFHVFALNLNVFGLEEQKIFMRQKLSETFEDSVDDVVEKLMSNASVNEYREILQTPLLLLYLTNICKDKLNDILEDRYDLANMMRDYREEKDKYLDETRGKDYRNLVCARENDKRTEAIISNAQ